MSVTITMSGVRRVAVGASATAQGRDGVTELSRTAAAALATAEWRATDDPPFIPVHDYAQNLPSGDAWKACYAFDDLARSERAACGAVCYTFAIPANALSGAACNITGIAVSIQGDRYLDAGANLHIVFSESAMPPTVAELMARTPDAASLCATGNQAEAPNQRHGLTVAQTISPVSQAATAYVHVALLLADYLGARGAWIEGGAMLVRGEAEITFSRDVSIDGGVPLDLGLPSPTPEGSPADGRNWWRLSRFPFSHPSYECSYYVLSYSSEGRFARSSFFVDPCTAAVESLFCVSVGTPVGTPTDSGGFRADIRGLAFGSIMHGHSVYPSIPVQYVEGPGLDLSVLCLHVAGIFRSGHVPRGRYTVLELSSFPWYESDPLYSFPDHVGLPLAVCIYAARETCSVSPSHQTIGNRDFWRGRLTSMDVLTSVVGASDLLWSTPGSTMPEGWTPPSTAKIPVTPLAAFRIEEGEAFPTRIGIAPLVSDGGVVTVLLAIRPDYGGTDVEADFPLPITLTMSLLP